MTHQELIELKSDPAKYQAHLALHRKANALYRARNPEKCHAYDRKYREKLNTDPVAKRKFLLQQRKHKRQYIANHPDRVVETAAKHRQKKKEKYRIHARAHGAVRRAIKHGILIRSERCEACGAIGYTEAHHNDYTKLLEVQWLCRLCHRVANLRNRKQEQGKEKP